MLTDVRALLVGLIVLATIGFVIGTAIERNAGESTHETAAHVKAEGQSPESHREGSSESEATHAAEGASGEGTATESGSHERHAELKPLGVDIEAAPFVALAAAASLALALGGWLRPHLVILLFALAAAMAVLAALDVREVFHQSDESRTGLAALAGVIAALHLGAAVAAGVMGQRSHSGPAAPAATMPG
jgi:Flp pilus assembly protein TadB